jgi:hypothetical protein
MSNPVSAVVDGVLETPAKVLSMWQRPWFWVGAAVVVVILCVVVLYVAAARDYALAKLTAHAITSGAAAAPAAAVDQPAQPQPVQLAA